MKKTAQKREKEEGDDRVKNLQRVWVIKFVGFVLSFFFFLSAFSFF